MPERVARLRGRLARSPFLRDVRLLSTGTFVAQLVLLLLSPLLTRLFPPEHFGLFAFVMAVAGIAAVFSTLRLDVIIPAVRQDGFVVAYLQLILFSSLLAALGVAAGLLLFEDAIAARAGADAAGRAALYLVPVLLVDLACFAAAYAWAVREGQFRRLGRAQIARAVALGGVSVALGLLGAVEAPGVAMLLGQVAGDALFVAIVLAAFPRATLARLARPRPRRIRAALRANRASIRVLTVTQIMAAFYERASVFVIAVAYGPLEAGFYALATRVAGAPAALVSRAIGDVFRQRAARAWHAGHGFDALMRRGLALTLALSVLPFGALIWLTPRLTVPVFGPEWSGAVFTLQLMFLSALFGFNSGAFDKVAIIVRAHRFVFWWHGARLTLELAAGALALGGAIGHERYLIVVTGGRILLYLIKLGGSYLLARDAGAPRER